MAKLRLPAKLTRPRIHRPIRRVRLFAHLDRARAERRAACIVGPPGSGKTTLAANWLQERNIPGIWFQMDSGDSDLPTFFHHLGQGAQAFIRRNHPALPALTAEYLADVEGFSRRFFRELFARLPDDAAIVFDNCQEVGADSPLHRLLADAIEEVPHGLFVIFVSRRDVWSTHARLVANEDVALLDWDLLKLTPEETAEIANTRLDMSDVDVSRLHDRCGGWAAGVTLVLESRRQAGLKDDTTAADEAVFAYFADRIVEREPDHVRRLLALTSTLAQVPVSIARELTSDPSAGEILEDLHRRRLFTHRRPGPEPIYWYHALFRDFLRWRAPQVVGAEALNTARVLAGRLLDAAGNVDDAFDLYHESGEWQGIAQLVERNAARLLAQGRSNVVGRWICSLPEEVISALPWLRYWLGVSLTPTSPEKARLHLMTAFADFQSAGDERGETLTAAAMIDVHVTEWSDFRPLRQWVEVLAPRLGPSQAGHAQLESRITCNLLMAMVYVVPGHPQLPALAGQLANLLEREMDDNSRLSAATTLLAYSNLVWDEPLSRIAWANGAVICEGTTVSPSARMWWQIRAGLHHAVEGRYREALEALDCANAIATQNGLKRTFARDCLMGIYRLVASSALGDVRAMRLHAHMMLDTATTACPMAQFQTHYAKVHLALAADDPDLAATVAEAGVRSAAETGMPYLELLMRLHLAIALAVTRRRTALARCLDELRTLVRHSCFASTLIDANLIAAWDLLAAGERSEGLARLKETLGHWRISRSRHASLLLLVSSPILGELLSIALQEGIEVPHVRETIRRMRVPRPPESGDIWPWTVLVRTLGGFEVNVDGVVLEFPGKVPRKPLALLKAIVALGPSDVPVTRLMDALWPGEPGDAARRSFDVTVTRLRKLLQCPEAVVVNDEAVSLDGRLCWVDVRHFLARSEHLPSHAGMSELEALCASYTGTFLPGDEDEPWTLTCRERARGRFVDLVARLASASERAGHWEDAFRWYQRGIEADELVERFHQGAMRALIVLGRHAEALSAYRRLRRLLSVVLGINPSEETLALVRQATSGSVNHP